MSNEILLVLSVFIIYGSVIAFFKLFGKQGLYCFTVLATIAANIEVLIVIIAFGMEMTLGNVLFASTFLVTDIISELYGKKESRKAVHIGIATSVAFIILSQWWLLYTPSSNDTMMGAMKTVFSNTPRVMIASMLVYAVVQEFDVWAYHKIWSITEKRSDSKRDFLWLRNNGSTMVSQFLNDLLFTFASFWGIYNIKTLWSIVISSYIIFIVTSLADTPFVYLARIIKEKDDLKAEIQ